ncbi:AAA family ATPase [Acetobacterium carbinolicum]|uniref:AAA family ATPase n=1 Tax=Acetobacterium carbinolicum TaxID=52690 RepID=UPI0039C99F1D
MKNGINKEWTLHVENFAKIVSADIKIAPLMCFVGDNNSGKSYLMSLLWGLLTYSKDYFPSKPPETANYKVCEAFVKKNIGKDMQLSNSEIQLFIDWFNQILAKNARALTKKIFNYEMEIGKIEIRDYSIKDSLTMKWNNDGLRYSFKNNTITIPLKENHSKEDIFITCVYFCWNIVMEGIAAPLYTPVVKGRRNGEPVYLPASRTGFMLTYLQLLDASLTNSFSGMDDNGNNSTLTMPYVDFLRLILKFENVSKIPKTNERLIEFIEERMIGGKIAIKKEYAPTFNYIPFGSKRELPLYISSSVVAEVSPLLLLLKSNIQFNTMIIEEPEAHLHPRLQWEMAKLIIKLVNSGIPVWITTHSETILQHINNMIKLDNNKDKAKLMEEYSYSKEDMINREMITMYQFNTDNKGKTTIESLESNEYGFIVPTFNAALENLVNEVYAFQED